MGQNIPTGMQARGVEVDTAIFKMEEGKNENKMYIK